MAEKIMIVDDEKDIVFLLRDYFNLNGYEVITAYDAHQATEKLSEKPDLILLDINMPVKNGLDFCKQIRNHTDCPIIFLTARTEESDILAGLSVGGDDYITKPFNLRELLGRVQAHLRREKRVRNEKEAQNDGLIINYSGMSVTIGGAAVKFTKTEFEIIELLSLNPGQVFSREKIYECVIGYDADGDNTVITEHIRKIRKKFTEAGGSSYIETVWGLGYKWVK